MDKAEIEALLGESVGSTNLTTQERYQTLVQSRIGSAPRTPTGTGRGFIERNLQGLPIDTETGAPAWVKFQVALRGTPESKLGYLQEVYGQGNARLSDTGDPLIKVLDEESGKPKEIRVNEEQFRASDWATLAANSPEMAAGIAAMAAVRKIPGLNRLTGAGGVTRDVIAQSIGSELGGLPKDVIFDQKSLFKAAEERAKELPKDIAIGGAMELAARVPRIGSPFAGARGTIEEQQSAARQYFKDRFGIDYPQTLAEETGAPILRRIEATMAPTPGSSAIMARIGQTQQQRAAAIQNRMLNLPENATPAERLAALNEAQIGEEATEAIRRSVTPQQEAAEAAARGVERAGTAEVMSEAAQAGMTSRSLQAIGPVARELHPERVGAGIRARALQERAAFQGESSRLYDELRALPGGTDRIFDNAGLVADAKRIIRELPPVTKITTQPTGVVGPSGQPITRTISATEASKEFVPSDIVPRLREVIDNPKTLRSLEDLKQMRSDVDNAIAQGEAVPGVQTHYLRKIREAIKDEMDRSVNSLPDGKLKQAWQEANSYYKQNVGKFEEGNIARLFKDIEQRGFVRDEDIIRNIGPTEYASFKKFLGEGSPEFQAMKRSITDSVLEAATPLSGGVIEGPALIQQLKAMRNSKRAVFDDIFGARTRNFQELSDILSIGNARVDEAKFRQLIASGTPTGEAVRKLVQEQRNLDRIYRSKMIKDIAEKRVGEEAFDPSEFVDRFYNNASLRDIQGVVSQLHDQPELLQKIRDGVIQKIFYRAQRTAAEMDPSRLGRGEVFRPTNSAALERAFGDDLQKQKLELILGRQTYEDFRQLGNLLRGSEIKEASFGTAGTLSSGAQIANMMRGGLMRYASDWVKQRMYAIIMTRPVVKRALANQLVTPKRAAALGTGLLASEPLVEAVIDEFGNEAENVMQMLSDSAARNQGTQAPQRQQTPEDILGPRPTP